MSMHLLQVTTGSLTAFRNLGVNAMFSHPGLPDRVYQKVSDRKFYSPSTGERSKIGSLDLPVFPVVIVSGRLNSVA